MERRLAPHALPQGTAEESSYNRPHPDDFEEDAMVHLPPPPQPPRPLCTLVCLLSQGLPSQPQEASTFCLLPDLFVIFYPWNSAFDEFLEVFVCVCVGEWRIDLLLILFLPWDETLV